MLKDEIKRNFLPGRCFNIFLIDFLFGGNIIEILIKKVYIIIYKIKFLLPTSSKDINSFDFTRWDESPSGCKVNLLYYGGFMNRDH